MFRSSATKPFQNWAAERLRHKAAALLHSLSKRDREPVFGRLDGDMAGDLYGWAMDRNRPSKPPRIAISADGRTVGEVLPVWYRPDVGQHAFFFDLGRVCAAQRRVWVEARFENGRVLSNCPLRVRVPATSGPKTSEVLLFMHIAKTAGTAFREAIIDNYKHSETAYLYPHEPGFLVSDLRQLPLSQRANFRLVIGHFQYGLHTFLPQECAYVTIVREPIRRIISHFQFLVQTEITPPVNANLPEFLVQLLEQHATLNLDNLVVRCFSGVPNAEVPPGRVDAEIYERAVHNLNTGFQFVGHQEYSREAYVALAKRFDWSIQRPLGFVNRRERAADEVFDSVRPAIEHFNRWDCLLYRDIQRLFPVGAA